MGIFIGIAVLILLVFLLGMGIGREIYYSFDHGKWTKYAKPDPKAVILNVYSDPVKYVKNSAKYKTTVDFSDGFSFITHETNRKDNFMRYQISVDKELYKEIIRNAIDAHNKAVEKKLSDNKH